MNFGHFKPISGERSRHVKLLLLQIWNSSVQKSRLPFISETSATIACRASETGPSPSVRGEGAAGSVRQLDQCRQMPPFRSDVGAFILCVGAAFPGLMLSTIVFYISGFHSTTILLLVQQE